MIRSRKEERMTPKVNQRVKIVLNVVKERMPRKEKERKAKVNHASISV